MQSPHRGKNGTLLTVWKLLCAPVQVLCPSLLPDITMILTPRTITLLLFFPIKALQLSFAYVLNFIPTGLIQYVLFCVWLLLPNVVIVKLICVASQLYVVHFHHCTEFQCVNEYSAVYLFTVKGYLSVYFVTIGNQAAVNILVHVSWSNISIG